MLLPWCHRNTQSNQVILARFLRFQRLGCKSGLITALSIKTRTEPGALYKIAHFNDVTIIIFIDARFSDKRFSSLFVCPSMGIVNCSKQFWIRIFLSLYVVAGLQKISSRLLIIAVLFLSRSPTAPLRRSLNTYKRNWRDDGEFTFSQIIPRDEKIDEKGTARKTERFSQNEK